MKTDKLNDSTGGVVDPNAPPNLKYKSNKKPLIIAIVIMIMGIITVCIINK